MRTGRGRNDALVDGAGACWLRCAAGGLVNDLQSFVYLVHPEFFTLEAGRIRVATDALAQRQTIMKLKGFMRYPRPGWGRETPLTQVGMHVQADACKSVVEAAMMRDCLTR